jgi:small nuclear ribonucleoprotein (snRNP)-like protein
MLQDGTPEAAIIRREQELAAVEPLLAGDAATRSLRVVMFVDQEKGRLAAYTVDRGVAGAISEVAVPPSSREPSGRFRISLGTGDVSLESLRVGPWTTDEPVLDVRRATSVVGGDGRTIDGEIVSYDKASGEVLVRAVAGDVRLKLNEIEEIVLPRVDRDAEVADAAPATVRAVQASGGTIAGRLASVDEQSLRLRVAGIDDEVAIPLDDVLSLTSLVARPSPRELPGRVGTLIAGEASLKGCLVDGRDLGAAVAWLPQGAVHAAAVAVSGDGVDAVVEYVPRASREPVGDAQVEIGGIGGMVSQDALGFFVVTMLSEDGAAAQDGRLHPGDRLLAIKPRPEGGFVPTKGHDVQTVMNLMRGRVGSQVVLRVAAADGEPRDIDLRRGLIYVAGRDILDQALATHVRLASPAVVKPEDSVNYPSLAILRSGDVVPCAVDGMDAKGMRIRTPVADAGANDDIMVSESLVQAVELDPSVPARGIEKPRLDRLLMLPRSQRVAPPTHMVRLRDGDYLRGRLESLDDTTLVLDVRGEMKRLPRNAVARVIWLHPEEDSADAPPRAAAPIPVGLLVQGVAEGRRVTLVAEGLAEGAIRGTSPALGPGRIDLKGVDRLLLGRAIDGEADQLPYRQWKLRPAPEPKALRDAAAAK